MPSVFTLVFQVQEPAGAGSVVLPVFVEFLICSCPGISTFDNAVFSFGSAGRHQEPALYGKKNTGSFQSPYLLLMNKKGLQYNYFIGVDGVFRFDGYNTYSC